jgi:hypothetical protein
MLQPQAQLTTTENLFDTIHLETNGATIVDTQHPPQRRVGASQ